MTGPLAERVACVEETQWNCSCLAGKLSMTMKNDIVAVSLFSGAGGLDVASFLAGVPVIFSTDIDADCIETLRANELFADAEILQGDLREIDSSVFQDALKKRAYDQFIVIGGAPCQPFSKAGYWVGHETRRGINDPRAALVNEYLRVVTDLHPDGFVFENVESLLHPTNRVIVDRFIEIVTEQGYRPKIVRANAQDYGVPQKRHRLFILGTTGEFKSDEPRRTHCPKAECGATGLAPYVNVGEAIAGFDGPEFFEPEEVVDGGTYGSDLKAIPPGMNYKALTSWYGCPDPKFVAETRYWSFLLKLSPDMPSWTITAQPGPWIGPFHWDNRRLRVPEIAAIQTFPRGYRFCGTRRSIQKQIGNAVPSLMGKAMIEHVKESIE